MATKQLEKYFLKKILPRIIRKPRISWQADKAEKKRLLKNRKINYTRKEKNLYFSIFFGYEDFQARVMRK